MMGFPPVRDVDSDDYDIPCKRYRRLLPHNIEKEREREKRRKRAEGAKKPPANKKKRFDSCGRANCAANVAPMMALRFNGACLRMECRCEQ